ncbi:MAG: DUF937 domain-containing protein [Thermotogaceae bacterium]|nr:DUF937 domain-containing protein [Thermotogota bacterium]NLZ12732.1 DUF937 domain-containing protein [Thermotogaceae bacterium]HQQ66835.1 DUF937 domain-containing protein [Thermotogota bacterium]
MDILELFNMLTNDKTVDNLASTVGANKTQTKKLVSLAMPTMMKAMDRNTGLSTGADGLMKALKKHQDDDVVRMVKDFKSVDTNDGSKIVNHIFSDKTQRVEKNLAKQTALQTDQVSNVLSQLAPILLGALGNQQKEQGVEASNLSNFLNGTMEKTGQSGMMSMVESLLDKEKDGSIWDDILRLITGFFKKK